MKKIHAKLPLLAASLLLLTACAQAPDAPVTSTATTTALESAASIPTETSAPAASAPLPPVVQFTETEHRLLPPEQTFDAEFEAFYKEFTKAVRSKDMVFLDGILDGEVKSSFGGDPGKEYFHEHWAQNEQAMWAELENIIALGGTYYQEGEYAAEFGKCFVAPYIYTDFKKTGLDPFGHFVAIDKNVPVYEDCCDPPVIDTLDYSVVKFHGDNLYDDAFWTKGPDDAVGIMTLSGEIGHTRKKYLRSPNDYRLCIEQKDDEWKLLWLIAGD